MLDSIIGWSLHHRALVIFGALALALAGLYLAVVMPVDVFPDLTAPTVSVITEARGMSPGELETHVTRPLESALIGAPGVRRVRSSTFVGISIVWVEFEWGEEIFRSRQVVAERLLAASALLPPEVERPVLGPVTSIMGEVLFIALTSDRHDPFQMRAAAEELSRRLMAIPGVSHVIPMGGAEKQYQVVIDPRALRRFDLSLSEVERAAAQATRNASAGFVTAGGSEYLVEVRGAARTLEEIAGTAVAVRGGRPVTLRELAAVRIGEAVKRGEASAQGRKAVVVGIQKQPGANTLRLTRAVEEMLDVFEEGLEEGFRLDRALFRQADFIERAVHNVSVALRDGALLVVVVVLFFLANLRATLITLLALPLSLAAAVIALEAAGATINTMTLGGLAIAIGALVDDAIIDVENVIRRLRAEKARPQGERRPALAVVYDASREIRSSIFYATLIIAVVFVPLFFLSGVEGRLLKPLGLAYVTALLASLAVAMTVTPVLCLLLLPRSRAASLRREPPAAAAVKRLYAPLLRRTLARPGLVLCLSTLALLAAVWGALSAGREFLPPFNEGALTVSATTLPGTSLEISDRLGRAVEEVLLEQPEVTSVSRRTGRAELDEHAEGIEASEIDVSLAMGKRSTVEFLAALRRALATVPGMNIVIGQPISHRIDHMLSGTRATIAVKVFGDDLAKLRETGEAVRRIMSAVPGVVDLAVEQQVEIPYLRVRPEREALARHGLQVAQVTETLATAISGKPVARIFEGKRAYDLVVRFPDELREDPAALRGIAVETPAGLKVPLGTLARIERESGPNLISRENVQRKLVVLANVAGRDVMSVVEEVRRRVVESGVIPRGSYVEYGGQFESAVSAKRRLLVLGSFAVLAIFLLLQLALRRSRDALLVMINLPLALVGGVAGVWLSGGVIGLPQLVGFITLFGIATRNGLMLVSHIKHLREVEGEADLRRAVERGALERLIPILMTALATGLALVPLVAAGGEPGNEIQAPMAVVILWGIASSTLLNMVVLPALYLRFAPRASGDPRPSGLGSVGPAAALSPLALLALAAGLASCAGSAPQGGGRPPERPVATSSLTAAPQRPGRPGSPQAFPSGPLTLADVEAAALARHPALDALRRRSEAARGRLAQAGAFPNPRLQAATESNRFDDPLRSGEHIAGLYLPLPVGGRLGAAGEVERREVEGRDALLALRARQVQADARSAFADALAAELALAVREEAAAAAARAAEVSRRQLAEGEGREQDRLRLEIEEVRTAMELESARSDREKALELLAAAMGEPGAPLEGVRGELEPPSPGQSDALLAALDGHPRLVSRRAAVAAARARSGLVRAERIPDVTVGAAYRRLGAEDADAFDLSLGIDLPVFDRRGGALREAEALVQAAEAEAEEEAQALYRELETALRRHEQAAKRVASFESELLPRAGRALAIAESAYLDGAGTLFELVEARRVLVEARIERLEARRRRFEAWAEIEALVGE
jgi:CzcA family heavy metal efflux pump